MNRQVKYPKGTKVVVVEASDKRQMGLFDAFKEYIGKKGIVIGIGFAMRNIPNSITVLENDIDLYEIDTGIKTIFVPEEMLQVDDK